MPIKILSVSYVKELNSEKGYRRPTSDKLRPRGGRGGREEELRRLWVLWLVFVGVHWGEIFILRGPAGAAGEQQSRVEGEVKEKEEKEQEGGVGGRRGK